jgi:RNA polymerase-interacting CarD/CdnL/TRCF family regulator
MQFPTPESLADLATTLRDCSAELRKAEASLHSGAGIGSATLIGRAYEYANHEGRTAKEAAMLKSAQHLAQTLNLAHTILKDMGGQTRAAVQVLSEAEAKLKTQQSGAARVRG